ncbi:MAG: PAS domain S-box protein [Deltaproteobacteria bacterium]|nr:PAS domain S-box protein [Deltaproteobacteria bacterium]
MSQTINLFSLIQAAGDAVIAADAGGKILLWNKAAQRIFGFEEEEAVGQSLNLIIPERFQERHWTGYRRVFETGRTRYGTEVLRVPAVHKDGHPLSIAFTIALLPSEEGNIEFAAAIIRDETARFREERDLRSRLAELEKQCR